MGDVVEYSDILQEVRGCMNPGRLKLQSTNIVFKNIKTGKVDQFSATDVESAQWLVRARGFCLKLVFKSGTIHRFDGLKEAEYERLSLFIQKHYGVHLEHVNLSLKGWNWGLAKFTANALDFEVDGKPAFEVPLCNVSHSMTGKNEVTLEFHPNDDAPVSLMELRFHIPADANVDDPVQEFYKNVIDKADIIQATGDAVAIFQEIQCLTPRGRYDIKIYQTFMQLHGKTFDYKIPYTTILRLFLLPHRDGRQMFFVVSLDPPIKQGQTRYPFLILLFNKEDEMTLELGLSEEDLESKYQGKLSKETSGLEFQIVANIMKTLVNRKITEPGSYNGHSGTKSLACSYKAATGSFYPLERGFIFIPKPPIHVRFDEVASVNFARSSGSTTRSFDFEIETKGGTRYTFVGIEKDEYGRLYDFVSSKKLRVKNIGEKGLKTGSYKDDMAGSDEDEHHDAYLERMKAEGKERDEDDDETDSSDESFAPEGSGSDVAEEWDTDAASSSSEDEEGSGNDEEKKKRKEEKRKEKEKKSKTVRERGPRRKRKHKAEKDPDRPNRPTTAYMLWLNEIRESIKEKYPGISVTEIAKKGGEMWRELKDKTKWEEGAKEAKEKYYEKMEEYKEMVKNRPPPSPSSPTETSPKKKKSSASPKKPLAPSTAGAGASFKSKEFISSSESSESDDDKPLKRKGKSSEKTEKSKAKRASKRGAAKSEDNDGDKEEDEFAGLPEEEDILSTPEGSGSGSASGSGSGSEDKE